MTDELEDLLEDLSTLIARRVPVYAWQSVVVECNTVGSRSVLSATYYEAHSAVPQPMPTKDEGLPYEQTIAYLFELLRLLTAEQAPFQGAWYTARMTVDKQGTYHLQCDYDAMPQVSPALSEEEYVQDFQQFPRTEASTPEWLRAIVERHQLAYYEPEPF